MHAIPSGLAKSGLKLGNPLYYEYLSPVIWKSHRDTTQNPLTTHTINIIYLLILYCYLNASRDTSSL